MKGAVVCENRCLCFFSSYFFIRKYPLSLCIYFKQGASNLQASKPSKSEGKNTHSQCVFCRAKDGSRPKGVNRQKVMAKIHNHSVYFAEQKTVHDQRE